MTMKLNQADRAFWSIVAVAAIVGAGAWAVLCCGLWALAHQVHIGGWSALLVPSLLPAIVLVAFLAVANVAMMLSLIAQLRATRSLTRDLRTRSLPLSDHLIAAAERARLRDRLDVIHMGEPIALTYGLFRPRVAVSDHLVAAATDDELCAVLAHESQHVRARDPAKMVVSRSLRAALFPLPIVGALQRRYLVGRELAADRLAVRETSTASLAGALAKSLAGPTTLDLHAAAALSSETALEARLTQLETGHEPHLTGFDRHALAYSAVGAVALAGGMATASMGLSPLVARLCHCG